MHSYKWPIISTRTRTCLVVLMRLRLYRLSAGAGGNYCLEALLGWDCEMDPQLSAPTIFAAMIESITGIVVPILFGE